MSARKKMPEWRAWVRMRERCRDLTGKNFRNYGSRGIAVCERWSEFENFLADMGRRPSPQHSIDRIDNDGNYEPGNCRWATMKEQRANRRPRSEWSSPPRNEKLITYNGETHYVAEWGRRVGLARSVLRSRIRIGWSVERALTTPCA
jgi:hypothetical protein